MENNVVYSGTSISLEYKKKRGLFFIEELLGENAPSNIPLYLKEKLDKDSMEHIETRVKMHFCAQPNARVAFKDYRHFKNTLEDAGIVVKKYTFHSK